MEIMHETCTVYNTLDYLSKKWAMVILFEMRRNGGWIRFSELRTRLGDITPKVLAERLKELEQEKLIEHQVFAEEMPIRSEYRLTQSGTELTDIILDIKMWALKWKIDNKPCEKLNCCKCRLRSLDMFISMTPFRIPRDTDVQSSRERVQIHDRSKARRRGYCQCPRILP